MHSSLLPLFDLLHTPALAGGGDTPPVAAQQRLCELSCGYAELEEVDEALREAEQGLKAAHADFANSKGPRPEALYREVVRLREKSRRLLDELAEMFLGEDYRFGEIAAQDSRQ